MIKKVLLTILACLLGGYMIFALFIVDPENSSKTFCRKVQVEVVSGSDTPYFDEAGIRQAIEESELNPIDKSYAEINTGKIEKLVQEDKAVRKAECFKTIDGTVKLRVYQRTPIMRIMSDTGDFYLDSEGEIMPSPKNFAAHVPLASGYIDEEYAKNELYKLALYLHANKQWNDEIKQIYIPKNKDIEVALRRGDHVVIMGKPEDWEENMEKLLLFYEKGLNKIGWNRYSVINLKYKDRVICTKK